MKIKISFLLFLIIFLLVGCSEKVYTITFVSNGGDEIESITLKEEESFLVPYPYKNGYEFDGWYVDEELKTPFDESLKLTSNITLYAKYKDEVVFKVGVSGLEKKFFKGFTSSKESEYVHDLIYGYDTLVKTRTGEYVWDTTIVLKEEPTVVLNNNGTKTYNFKLRENLRFNNGDKINANNYIFTILLYSSIDMTDASSNSIFRDYKEMGKYIVGYDYFRLGTAYNLPFKGIRLINDYEFSLTINPEYLPNFNELEMVNLFPLSIEAILPGYDVIDSVDGAYITIPDYIPGDNSLTSRNLDSSIFSESIGQLINPTITSGPYKYVSYKEETIKFSKSNIVTLVKNPYYLGNYEGTTASLSKIEIYDFEEQDIRFEDFDFDLIPNQKEFEKFIDYDDSIKYQLYRADDLMLKFAGYDEITNIQEVRQALAYLIDRESLLKDYSNRGIVVDSVIKDDIFFSSYLKDRLNNNLLKYSLDIDKANELLDKTPYIYESDGVTLFDITKATSSNKYFRHDRTGNLLKINVFEFNNHLWATLLQNAWKAGVDYDISGSNYLEHIMNSYYYAYKEENQFFNAFIMNLDDHFILDNIKYLHSKYNNTSFNPTNISDPRLDKLIDELYTIDQTNNNRDFLFKLTDIIILMNEILPVIPIYTTYNYDIYKDNVSGIKTTRHWSFAKGICDIKFID